MTTEIVETLEPQEELPFPIPEPTILSSEPNSMINLVSDKVRESILNIPPNLLSMDVDELEKKASPTPTLHKLKYQFWREYEFAQNNNLPMQMKNVFEEICSPEHFYGRVLRSQILMAWMIKPITSYKIATEEALSFGIRKLRRILAQPIENKNGEINTAQANLVLRIVAFLDQRVNGAVIQKSLNINVTASDRKRKELETRVNNMTATELEQKLKDLERDTNKSHKRKSDIVIVEPNEK